jgi:hypothetical protein
MERRRRTQGSAMVEFTIAGLAAVGLIISIVQVGLAMWNYHTLAYAVHETNRYIASHGRGCTGGGNNCAITVANIATKLKSNALGIPSDRMSMTLTSQSGVVHTCDPVSSCANDTTQWPPVPHLDNNAGSFTKITAKTTLHVAILTMWFGSRSQAQSSLTFPATSNIPIVF